MQSQFLKIRNSLQNSNTLIKDGKITTAQNFS